MELTNEQPVREDLRLENASVAVLSQPRTIIYQRIVNRDLGSDEILVELEGCGICASNIPVWEGRPWFEYPQQPGAPGHEGWGVIVDTGDNVDDLQPGQRVSVLSGQAFASHTICKAAEAIVLPESFAGKPFPGEPVGCAMNVFERSDVREGQTVAIIGIGFLGAILIQLAKNAGAHVIAISRRESSIKLAEEVGADQSFHYDEKDDLWAHINKVAPEDCDRVIECVGNQQALDLASEIIGVRGKLVIGGYHQEGMRHINMQVWNWKGIDVINAHERDPQRYRNGIENAIEAIEKGEIKIQSLLTHQYHYLDLSEAMETLTNYPEGFTKAYIYHDHGNYS